MPRIPTARLTPTNRTLISHTFQRVDSLSKSMRSRTIPTIITGWELCYGQKNVSELAYEYGFSSLAHLSSQFKSLTGMSPKQFQQLDRPKPFALRNSLDKIWFIWLYLPIKKETVTKVVAHYALGLNVIELNSAVLRKLHWVTPSWICSAEPASRWLPTAKRLSECWMHIRWKICKRICKQFNNSW